MGLQIKRPGKAAKGAPGASDGKPSAFQKYRKQIITTGITVAACLLVIGIARMGASVFSDGLAGSEADYVALENEIGQFRQSDPYFTGESGIMTEEQVRIEWAPPEGTTEIKDVDTAKWQADEKAFWGWIKPAFNFGSATEYNQTREDYIRQLGNCLFTTQFLTYYDTEGTARRTLPEGQTEVTQFDIEKADKAYTCTAKQELFRSWVIGIDEATGDYTYAAMVPMQLKNSPTATGVLFTYTVSRTPGKDGTDNVSIKNFDCWPPNSSALYQIGTNG